MSDGLHHVAPASFFPTAKELSSGLQWFKEHPILAAAAATAVSVITFLNTADDSDAEAHADLVSVADEGGREDEGLLVDSLARSADGAALSVPNAAQALTRRRASSPSVITLACQTDDSSPQQRTNTPVTVGRTTPPALRKPGSEGKMSPAVSWVDEHGGSLTQVFEHLSAACDDDDDEDHSSNPYPDLDGPLRIPSLSSRPQGLPPTPRRAARTNDDESSQAAGVSSGHWMGSLGVQSPQLGTSATVAGDRQSESPQWGWYVPITPPQDHLPNASSSSLPRAVSLSASSNLGSYAVAAMMNAGVRTQHRENPSASSMRRSASGRIKAA